MNRGLVNLKELRNNFEKADFKQGKSSYCFIQGDKVIKVYALKHGEQYFPDNVYDFSKFKADTIVFPLEYIYEKGKIVGEISQYIKSEAISKSFNDKARVNSIIEGYELVVNDLQLYKDINMADLCYVNILYSNELGFHIIDTTEWQIRNNSFHGNLYRLNMSLIDALIESIEMPIIYSKYYSKVDETYFKNLDKFGASGKELKRNIEILMNNKCHFIALFMAYMEAYRVYSGTEAQTLKDINEFTKVLKKS